MALRYDAGEVITAMVTPFNSKREIDYNKAEELAKYLITHGTDAVLVAGTTGEGPTLTHEEEFELLSTVKRAVANKAKVIMYTITFCGVSGFFNLLIMVFNYKNWFSYLYVLSLLSMFWSFIFFIKSMHNIYNLIKNIHEFDKQGGNKKNQKSETKLSKDTW